MDDKITITVPRIVLHMAIIAMEYSKGLNKSIEDAMLIIQEALIEWNKRENRPTTDAFNKVFGTIPDLEIEGEDNDH